MGTDAGRALGHRPRRPCASSPSASPCSWRLRAASRRRTAQRPPGPHAARRSPRLVDVVIERSTDMTHSVSQAPPRRPVTSPARSSDRSGRTHRSAWPARPCRRGRNESGRRALAAACESSGLTGRGGGGFPTSIKLALARSGGRRNGRGQRHGGRAGERQGQGAADPGSASRARRGADLAAVCRADRILVCIPAGRDAVAAAVKHGHRGAPAQSLRPSDASGRAAAGPLRRRRGVGLGELDRHRVGRSRRSGRTRARPSVSGGGPPWCTTPRRWPMSASSPATVPRPSGPGAGRGARYMLVTVCGAVAQPGVVEVDRGTPLQDIVARGGPRRASPGDAGRRVRREHGSGPQHFGDALRIDVAAHHRCLGRRRRDRRARREPPAGSPSRRVSPATWPGRVRVSAGPACSGCRPSPTTWPCSPGGRADAGLMARLQRRLDEVDGTRGMPTSRRRRRAWSAAPCVSSPPTWPPTCRGAVRQWRCPTSAFPGHERLR